MAEIKTPDISVTGLGNVLAGLALAFLVDNIFMQGAVTSVLPDPLKVALAFIIFGGATFYGYKQAKKLN